MINWVSVAWKLIHTEIMVRSFMKCGISNSVDGSEDNPIREKTPVITNKPSYNNSILGGGDRTAQKFSNNSRFSPEPIILKIILELSAHPYTILTVPSQ